MSKTVVGYFDNFAEAQSAVRALVGEGFLRDNISLVASDARGEYTKETTPSMTTEPDSMSNTAAGAGTGAVVGGIGGLLVGMGALALPGIGPVVAAGPIASMLLGAGVGAAAGGLIGVLIDAGIPEEEATYYAEGLRRGGAVVTVTTPDETGVQRAVNIFERYDVVNIDRRVEEWRKSGWTGYDSQAEPYGAAATRQFDDYVGEFRRDYMNTYQSRGYTFEQVEPAYRYGYTLANNDRYRGRDWASVEADARRDWGQSNQGAWEDFKEAVRYGWDRVRGYSAQEATAREEMREHRRSA